MVRVVIFLFALVTGLSAASPASARYSEQQCQNAKDTLATLPSENDATPESDAMADRNYEIWSHRDCANIRARRHFSVSREVDQRYDNYTARDRTIRSEMAEKRRECEDSAERRWQKGSDRFRENQSRRNLASVCIANATNALVQKYDHLRNQRALRRGAEDQSRYAQQQADWAYEQQQYQRSLSRWRRDVDRCYAGDWSACDR